MSQDFTFNATNATGGKITGYAHFFERDVFLSIRNATPECQIDWRMTYDQFSSFCKDFNDFQKCAPNKQHP
jgi:hypothetical protein